MLIKKLEKYEKKLKFLTKQAKKPEKSLRTRKQDSG